MAFDVIPDTKVCNDNIPENEDDVLGSSPTIKQD